MKKRDAAVCRRWVVIGGMGVGLFGLFGCANEGRAPSVTQEAAPPPAAAPAVYKDSPQARRALRDLEELREAMLRYRKDVGELPPRGDYCAVCVSTGKGTAVTLVGKAPRSHMVELEQALVKKDGPRWKGPYLKQPIPLDPWGREYTYDDNDVGSGQPSDSHLWSAGPDGYYGNGDDVQVLVQPAPKK